MPTDPDVYAWLAAAERGEFARKALPKRRPALAGNRYVAGWTIGSGDHPWAPGARSDIASQAGDLHANAIVALANAWMRRNVAKGRLVVGTRDVRRKLYEPIEDHPLEVLLKRPNPWQSRDALFGGLSDSLGVDGNAYLIKVRAATGGPPVELWWVPNNVIEVVASTNPDAPTPIEKYTVTVAGNRRDYLPADVVHLRDGLDPANPLFGIGPIKRQIRAVAGYNYGERYSAAVLRWGHAGKILVPGDRVGDVIEGSPDEAVMRRTARQVEQGVSGENSGRITLASVPLDILDVGMGPEELALDRILDRPEAQIVAARGLNAMVLGLPSSERTRTYSNWAEARRSAWEDAVIPLQDTIACELCQQLLYTPGPDGTPVAEWGDPDGLDCWWDRSEVEALREDAEARANRAVALFTSGLLPQNRALQEGGFDPIDEEYADSRYHGDPTPEQEERAARQMEMQAQVDAQAAASADPEDAPAEDDEDMNEDA